MQPQLPILILPRQPQAAASRTGARDYDSARELIGIRPIFIPCLPVQFLDEVHHPVYE